MANFLCYIYYQVGMVEVEADTKEEARDKIIGDVAEGLHLEIIPVTDVTIESVNTSEEQKLLPE